MQIPPAACRFDSFLAPRRRGIRLLGDAALRVPAVVPRDVGICGWVQVKGWVWGWLRVFGAWRGG